MDYPRPPLRIETAGGNLLDDALAKREDIQKGQQKQTYRQHLIRVYKAWCGLKLEYADWVGRVAQRHNLTPERLLQSSLLCVVFHDLGKLTINFQNMMTAPDGEPYRRAVRRNYRHEIAGLWAVRDTAKALSEKFGKISGGGNLETLAVAGHHRSVSHDLPDQEDFVNSLTWMSGANVAFTAARELAQAMFKDQGWSLPYYKHPAERVELELSNGPKGNFPFACVGLAKNGLLGHDVQALSEIFTLLKGLLMTADWMASGASGRHPMQDASRCVVRIPRDSVLSYLEDRHAGRYAEHPNPAPFEGFRPFQTECAQAEVPVLAIAPTGSGKTEAALAWALRQVELNRARKILFLLPTMVTANSIHERLSAFFDKHGHRVGLVHSTADFVRDSEDEAQSEADRADARFQALQESHLFPPVTVGTVDQLLVTLFHAGRWAMKTLAAANAAIIFDEIHAYEPHTLGLIVALIRRLRAQGTPFFVMSATMPSCLRGVVLNALALSDDRNRDVKVIEEKTLLDQARNDWSTEESSLVDWLFEAWGTEHAFPSSQFLDLRRERGPSGKPLRILIVVNTVGQCQALARALKEFKPICYHSKFIFRDRRRKERQINKCPERPPRLLIATQVVEVSLDIDYDVLLTECAPMDALVQRAGRVNRARLKQAGRVVVHRHDETSERIYGQPSGILARTWESLKQTRGMLTERQLGSLVEEVYREFAIKDDEAFVSIQGAIKEHQERLSGVLDAPHPSEENALLKTRLDNYAQESVIPEGFTEIVLGLHPRKRRQYELKMPRWYTKCHSVAVDGVPFCEMEYDRELGGRFLPVDGHSEPSCEVY